MRVFLTFDIEIWCDGWEALDERFPAAFQRYIYGRSPEGDYALPKTLEIMNRHGLLGVFFVEPLFAARGQRHANRDERDRLKAPQKSCMHRSFARQRWRASGASCIPPDSANHSTAAPQI